MRSTDRRYWRAPSARSGRTRRGPAAAGRSSARRCATTRCRWLACLQPGPLARQRRDEIAGADRAVDTLAAPVELPGRGKGTRDRRPGQRKVDIAERLGDVIGGIFIAEHAVLDPDFGE